MFYFSMVVESFFTVLGYFLAWIVGLFTIYLILNLVGSWEWFLNLVFDFICYLAEKHKTNWEISYKDRLMNTKKQKKEL